MAKKPIAKENNTEVGKYEKKFCVLSKKGLVAGIVCSALLIGGGAGTAIYFALNRTTNVVTDSNKVIINPSITDATISEFSDINGDKVGTVTSTTKTIAGVKVTIGTVLLNATEYKAEKVSTNAASSYKVTIYKATLEKYKDKGIIQISPDFEGGQPTSDKHLSIIAPKGIYVGKDIDKSALTVYEVAPDGTSTLLSKDKFNVSPTKFDEVSSTTLKPVTVTSESGTVGVYSTYVYGEHEINQDMLIKAFDGIKNDTISINKDTYDYDEASQSYVTLSGKMSYTRYQGKELKADYEKNDSGNWVLKDDWDQAAGIKDPDDEKCYQFPIYGNSDRTGFSYYIDYKNDSNVIAFNESGTSVYYDTLHQDLDYLPLTLSSYTKVGDSYNYSIIDESTSDIYKLTFSYGELNKIEYICDHSYYGYNNKYVYTFNKNNVADPFASITKKVINFDNAKFYNESGTEEKSSISLKKVQGESITLTVKLFKNNVEVTSGDFIDREYFCPATYQDGYPLTFDWVGDSGLKIKLTTNQDIVSAEESTTFTFYFKASDQYNSNVYNLKEGVAKSAFDLTVNFTN